MPSVKVGKEIKEYNKYLPLLNDLWKEKVPSKDLPKIYFSFLHTLGVKETERILLHYALGHLVDYVDFRYLKIESSVLPGREEKECLTYLPPCIVQAFKYIYVFIQGHFKDTLKTESVLDYRDLLHLVKGVLSVALKIDVSNYAVANSVKNKGD